MIDHPSTNDPRESDPAFTDARDVLACRLLEQAGRLDAPAPGFQQQLRARLQLQAGAHIAGERIATMPVYALARAGRQSLQEPRARTPRRGWFWNPRARVTSVVAAAVLVLGGVGVYQHANGPAPVSAQTLLRNVAAALPSATDQVFHRTEVTRDLGPTGYPVTVRDTWTQLNASGDVTRQAIDESTTSGILMRRIVLDGSQLHEYDAVNNVVTNTAISAGSTATADHDPYGVPEMRQIVASARQSTTARVQMLPEQTLDGRKMQVVKVVSVPGKGPQSTLNGYGSSYLLLYIDSATYVVFGVDTYVIDGRGHTAVKVSMRTELSATLAPTAVPADTFAFNPPASATVAVQPRPNARHSAARPISVAQGVAIQGAPALFLAGDPDGLKLQELTRQDIAQTTGNTIDTLTIAGTYVYSRYLAAHKNSSLDASLEITVFDGGPKGPAAVAAAPRPVTQTYWNSGSNGREIRTSVRTMNLTIAGKPVTAAFDISTGCTSCGPALSYQANGTTVNIWGRGLDESGFLSAIAALQDGQSNPSLVASLQTELTEALAHPICSPVMAVCSSDSR